MLFNFSKNTTKEQIHIIDGKIVRNYFLHPMNASSNKEDILKIFSKSFSDYKISPVNKTNKIFKVEKDGIKRFFSIDVTDFGGREDGGVKVEIPFSNASYSQLLREGELVSVINLYIPLKSVDLGFELDEENTVYIFLNPLQMYVASGYEQILKGKKAASSNRWTTMDNILNVINSGISLNTKPQKARKAMVSSQYMSLIPYRSITNSFIDTFERNALDHQIKEWKQMANEFNFVAMSDEKNKQQLQAIFRRSLVAHDGMVCLIETCQVQRSDLLVASHIKPKAHIWNSDISNEKKVRQITDANNGMVLCIKHDALFDRGYVTFDEEGFIKSTKLIDIETFEDLYSKTDNIPKSILDYKERYLTYHRENVFK